MPVAKGTATFASGFFCSVHILFAKAFVILVIFLVAKNNSYGNSSSSRWFLFNIFIKGKDKIICIYFIKQKLCENSPSSVLLNWYEILLLTLQKIYIYYTQNHPKLPKKLQKNPKRPIVSKFGKSGIFYLLSLFKYRAQMTQYEHVGGRKVLTF